MFGRMCKYIVFGGQETGTRFYGGYYLQFSHEWDFFVWESAVFFGEGRMGWMGWMKVESR